MTSMKSDRSFLGGSMFSHPSLTLTIVIRLVEGGLDHFGAKDQKL